MSRRHARLASLVVAVCAGAGVAGCGSTTFRHVTTTITRSASSSTSPGGSSRTTSASTTTSSTTSSSASSSSGRTTAASRPAAASPRALVDRAAAALRASDGYAMHADLLQSGTRSVIDLAADSAHRYSASLTVGPQSFQLIALPGAAYLKGNQAFWVHQVAHASAADRRRAELLAGHWLRAPKPAAVTSSLGTLSPGTLARCLVEDHGTLSIAGHETVAGTRAVVVRDAGNVPGSTPSTIAVAATGRPYPLRYLATGRTRPGGRVDVCNDGKGDGATGVIDLSQFGTAPAIQAPATTGSAPGTGV